MSRNERAARAGGLMREAGIGALFLTKPANLFYFTGAGHAYFHGETEAPPLRDNTVLAVGNCELYMDDFGVRIQDTLVVTASEPVVLTDYARRLP